MREPWPELDQATRSVRSAFYRFRAKPGLAVFRGRGTQDRIAQHMCLIVFGRNSRGELDVLHESYPDCRYPAVRWSADTFNLVLSQLIGSGRLEGLAKSRGREHRRRVTRFQKARVIDRASRYFCNRHDAAMVYVVAKTSAIMYQTDERFAAVDVIHQFNCETDRRGGPSLEVELVDGKVVVE